jgi:GTP pyrophosphokinase
MLRPEKVLRVSWGGTPSNSYTIDIAIEALDRPGLSRDISNLIANEKALLLSFNTHNDKSNDHNYITLTVEVTNLDAFQHLLKQLQHLPDVISAQRK